MPNLILNSRNSFACFKPLFFLLALFSANIATAQCTATLTALTPTTICPGSNITLQAGPTGLYDYQWFINGFPTVLGDPMYTSNETWGYEGYTLTYQVQITDNNNCTVMSNPVTITVLPSGFDGWTYNTSPVCAGAAVQLVPDTINGNTISWTGPNNFSSNLAQPNITNLQTADTGWYYITAFNGQCTYMDSTYVSIYSPTATLDLVSNWDTACAGTFYGSQNPILGGGIDPMSTFTWTGPNNYNYTDLVYNLGGTWFDTAQFSDAGIYTLTINGNACSGPVTLTETLNVYVNQNPTVSISGIDTVCAGGTLQLNGNVSGGTYQWGLPDYSTSNQLNLTIPNAQASNSGQYILTSSIGPCYAWTSIDAFVLTDPPSVEILYADYMDTATICATTWSNWSFFGAVSNVLNPVCTWTGPNNYSWSGPACEFTDTLTSLDSGVYYLTVTGMSCSGPVTLQDSFRLNIVDDCVWPGDANNDHIVNNMDVLEVGLAYATFGPARPTPDNTWSGNVMPDWGVMQYCNQDMKYADCNGNGIITASDTNAIGLNYGSLHLKEGPHMPMAKSASFPDLYFDMTGVNLISGSTVTIPIKFGTTTTPMVNTYGIAAEIRMDGIYAENGMTVDPAQSWLGNNNNSMTFLKEIDWQRTDWAQVRTDHNNTNGDGTIATLTFTVPQGFDGMPVQLYLNNVKIIGNTGNVITDVNIVDVNTNVLSAPMVNTASVINNAVVVPNPSEEFAQLRFSLQEDSDVQIMVTDIVGKKVWNDNVTLQKGLHYALLPSSLAPGLYTIQVREKNEELTKTIKWIKK